jgi:dolichyl-phosphate-mannose--protein O-mannosyl transferase
VGGGPSSPDLRKVRSGEDFDILIGFVGFWAAVLFIVTAFLEVTGKNALLPAMILLVLVLVLWGLVRLRRKLPPRTARRHR